MGTSSRRLVPDRMKDKIKDLKFDDNNKLLDSDFKDLLKTVFYPNGRESYSSINVIKSCSSTSFIRTIRKIVDIGNSYGSYGYQSFGISNFDSYTFEEQVDLVADYLVEDDDPILKQSIKDLLFANGFDNTFGDTHELLRNLLIKLLIKHSEGILFDSLFEQNEKFDGNHFEQKMFEICANIADVILNANSLNTLVINVNNENYVSNWLQETVRSFLRGVAK